MMTQKTTKPVSIQERMQNKAFVALGEVEHQIDRLLESSKSSFSMYKYVKQLGYSGRVVNYMKGFTEDHVSDPHDFNTKLVWLQRQGCLKNVVSSSMGTIDYNTLPLA